MLWNAALFLVLSFDGSLRSPRDPGYSTEGLGRQSSCAACLWDDNGKLLSLGGKLLTSTKTSAEAEYAGLLLGLERLQSWPRSSRLVVQGDCKTVLSQMSGMSKSRKLDSLHQRALDLVLSLDFDSVQFVHVPREKNELADEVCSRILWEQQKGTYEAALGDVGILGVQEWFAKYATPDRSLIPHSQRPFLYDQLVSMTTDPLSYVSIGHRLAKEATFTKDDTRRKILQSKGVRLESRGLTLSGQEKEADRLLRKHRYLLSMFPSDTIELEHTIEGPVFSSIVDDWYLQACASPSWTTADHAFWTR